MQEGGIDLAHALTPHPARHQPEEEHHQLPPVEDVPQDHRPSQAKLSRSRVAAHPTLYTTCIPTARRDGQCASAHAGGVLSAITTLGRRSGEVDTVVYMQYKRRIGSTMITYASRICAVQDSGNPAFVTSRNCNSPASHIAADNAIMCNVLTHCFEPVQISKSGRLLTNAVHPL